MKERELVRHLRCCVGIEASVVVSRMRDVGPRKSEQTWS